MLYSSASSIFITHGIKIIHRYYYYISNKISCHEQYLGQYCSLQEGTTHLIYTHSCICCLELGDR